MKKIIFAAFILGIIALSWQPHCDHVFVAVEQPELKIQTSFPTMTTTEVKHPLTGKHEGRELVCVKCLYRQKQIIDYPVITATDAGSETGLCCTIDTTRQPTIIVEYNNKDNLYDVYKNGKRFGWLTEDGIFSQKEPFKIYIK